MKKLLVLVLVAMLTFGLVACSAPAETTPETTEPTETTEPAETAKEKLVVGTSADFAPYEFIIMEDGQEKIVGFDIDLAQAIADDLGMELEIKNMSFDAIITEVVTGDIDLGISGFSPTPERAEVVSFSELYYMGGQSFIINVEDEGVYESYEDFTGLQVGAQTGSIQAELLAENTPDAIPVLLQKVPDIIAELSEGKIEGAFMETAIAESYIKNYPNVMIAWDVEFDSEGSAIAVNQENTELLEAVNATIAKLLESGEMDNFVAAANEIIDQDITG